LDSCVARVNLSLLSNPTGWVRIACWVSRSLVVQNWSRIRASFRLSGHQDLRDEKISGYGRDVVQKPTPVTGDEPRMDPALSPLVLSLSSPVPNHACVGSRMTQASHVARVARIGRRPRRILHRR
jgi:hypothetical protein